jgi:YggT family protein
MLDAFTVAIVGTLIAIISLYKWIVIISALISWVQPDPNNPIIRVLYQLTEPVYRMIRRKIPTVFGGMDLAPLIVIFALQFLEIFLGQLFR